MTDHPLTGVYLTDKGLAAVELGMFHQNTCPAPDMGIGNNEDGKVVVHCLNCGWQAAPFDPREN